MNKRVKRWIIGHSHRGNRRTWTTAMREGGYTLIWVLMLSVLLITLVSAVMYSVTYGMKHVTSTFRNDTLAPYASDYHTQGNVQQIEQTVTDVLNSLSGTSTDPSAGLSAVEQQLAQEGYTTTVTGSYTDANGNLHEIVQVTDAGGSSINLDLTYTPTKSGPSQPQSNPYPYDQYQAQYVADGNTTNQTQISQIDSTNSGNTQPYILVHSSTADGQPTNLSLNSGTQLTYGADGNMAELITGNVQTNKDTSLTVDGTLDAGSLAMESNSTTTVTGDLIATSVQLNSGATLNVSGQLTVDSLTLNKGSTLTVGGQAYDGSGLSLNSDAGLTITHDATIGGGITLNGTTILHIEGNLYETGDITLNRGTTLQVDKNAKITGNVTVNGSASMKIGENMCISGSLTMYSQSTVQVQEAAMIAGGLQGSGGTFTSASYTTTGACPVPQTTTYTLTSVTEV